VRAGHFASRNRLQVALAAAVVLVECPQRSGALLTADLAWQQGLPLWVVPADAAKASAAGSNRLLARGATPLLAADELIDMLGGPGPLAQARQRTAPIRALSGPVAAEGQGSDARGAWGHRLLQAVGQGASLEQLTLALGRPGEELAASLLELELAGVLRAEPGLRWGPTGRDGGG
jgi:DNA processing protein